jgi:hypothetical protein
LEAWTKEMKATKLMDKERQAQTILSFWRHLRKRLDSRVQEESDTLLVLYDQFPAAADFKINDICIFAEQLRAVLINHRSQHDPTTALASMLDDALQTQADYAWNTIKGCPCKCPLCGSKCEVIGSHKSHSCSHHVFASFHGIRSLSSNEAATVYCLSTDVQQRRFRNGTGAWYVTTKQYLQEEHPKWLPLPETDLAEESLHLTTLKKAWVNARHPLLKYYKMKDGTPEAWDSLFKTPEALDASALQKAEREFELVQSGQYPRKSPERRSSCVLL